jgi:hypothetical protein
LGLGFTGQQPSLRGTHRANADPLPTQALEAIRRKLIKRHNVPIAQHVEEASEPRIGWNLSVHAAPAVDDDRQPTAKQLLHAHDGGSHRLRGRLHAMVEWLVARIALIGKNR